MSPIRPVKSPITARRQVALGVDVLPPWKQEGYVEGSYTTVTSGATRVQTSSTTQVQMEQHWEASITARQQASAAVVTEVSLALA